MIKKNLSGVFDSLLSKHNYHWRVNREIRKLGRLKGTFYRNVNPEISLGRAFVFCTSYINDVERYQRWIDYTYSRRTAFGVDSVILINDGYDNVDFDDRLVLVETQKELPKELPNDLLMFTFPEQLGRSSMFCYPGWWRSFTYAVKIAQMYGFDKIIHIESDAYVCSKHLADYIRSINCGWTTLWSNHYFMPETAIQVICKDAFKDLEDFISRGDEFFQSSNTAAEYLLPFRKVETRFSGDRYWPLSSNHKVSDELFDYLTQVRPDWEFRSDF